MPRASSADRDGSLVRRPRLGRLLNHYERAAHSSRLSFWTSRDPLSDEPTARILFKILVGSVSKRVTLLGRHFDKEIHDEMGNTDVGRLALRIRNHHVRGQSVRRKFHWAYPRTGTNQTRARRTPGIPLALRRCNALRVGGVAVLRKVRLRVRFSAWQRVADSLDGNCNCRMCVGVRSDTLRAIARPSRAQSSIAVGS
jgi:hypothetical protein